LVVSVVVKDFFIFNLNTNKGLAFFENDAAAVVVVVDAVEVDL